MSYLRIDKLKFILGRSTVTNLFILYLGLLFLSFIEIIGLGIIPFIVSAMIDPSMINSYVGFDFSALITKLFGTNNIILFLSFLIIAVFAFKVVYLLIINYYELSIIKKIKIKLSQSLIKSYVLKPYIFFLNQNSSNISKNVLMEIDYAVTFLRSLIQIMKEITLLAAILILLLIFEPLVIITTFSVILLFVILFLFSIDKNLKKIAKHRVAFLEGIFKATFQLFGAIREIKVFKKEKFFLNKFNLNKSNFEQQLLLADFIKSLPRIFFEFIAILIISSIIISFTILDKNLSLLVPFMSLLAASVIRMSPSFSSITAALTHIKVYKNSYNIVVDEIFLFLKNNLIKHKNGSYPTEVYNINDKNIVKTNNLEFSYIDNEQNKNYSIKNVSFNIDKDSMVGIFGKSGAGKSTLINILLRLLDPEKGKLVYNFSSKDPYVDSKISFVPQDIYLLDDTIKNNIAFGIDEKLIDEERVIQCLKDVEMWDFVKKNPAGLNLLVGEKGIRLSGGEKQRIGLARALCTKPEILILDEATNALDYKTENEVFKSIKKLRNKTTIIIISHKISLLDECDKIFYLENGKMKDEGNYDKLLKKYPDIKGNRIV